MPPKKKGKGKKKKKDDAELVLEENYKRTMEEIAALKDQLSMRKEVARRAKSAGLELRERMVEASSRLQEHEQDQKSVSADMTRQYKTMQTEMNLRIHQLESERDALQLELENTQETLRVTIIQKDKEIADKNAKTKELEKKIKDLMHDFDLLLQDSFSSLLERLEVSRNSWEDKSTLIQSHNKQVLMDFHLNPLDI